MATFDLSAAIAEGESRAKTILDIRASARQRREATLKNRKQTLSIQTTVRSTAQLSAGVAGTTGTHETAGVLVAAGDSWFAYPFYDVLKKLDSDHGYDIESVAHPGDPIEAMASCGGQLLDLAHKIEKLAHSGKRPKAVLLSGGGDDIAGREFGMLINENGSSLLPWNDDIVHGLIDVRIQTAYATMITTVNQVCLTNVSSILPILVHGYDYPVPDGRGILGGWGSLPGPWLRPGFNEKRFGDLATNITLMQNLIDRFNAMLSALVSQASFRNVKYVDIRRTLRNDQATYKDWWGNELHPTEGGFEAVANRFVAVLDTLPN